MNPHLDSTETRLREHLASVDQTDVSDIDTLRLAADRAGHHLHRRRQATVGIAAAACVAIGGVALWAVRSDPSTPVTASSTTEDAAPPTTTVPDPSPWTALSRDPRGPTWRPSVVWTGTEAIVVGGLADGTEARGGAVGYDPSTDTWRTLASPFNGARRIHPIAVWTGQEALLIGGDNPDGSLLLSYGEAYDPAEDTWRYTQSPPIGFVSDRSPWVWTGDELLVWPWDGDGHSMPITPIAYNPAADTWRELPEPPVERRQQAASVWTGSEWVVWGGLGNEAELTDGVAYNPTTNTWRVLAPSPLSSRRVQGAAWTGSEMLVTGGFRGGDRVTGNGTLALADGAAYNPATDTWRALTEGPAHPGFVPVWTGDVMVAFAKNGAVIFDPAANRWTNPPDNDTRAGGEGNPVWTGSVVLVMGSNSATAGGVSFDPE